MASITRKITSLEQGQSLIQWIRDNVKKGLQGGPVLVTLGRESRTKEQNRKMWPLLTDLSKQHEWFNQLREPEEWKVLVMSAYKGETNVVPGINGEVVNLGLSTSGLNKAEFSELIEFIYALGSGWGIKWSDPALAIFDEYREAKSNA